MNKKQTYKCINCNLYDELESYAIRKTELTVSYISEDGREQLKDSFIIVDFETKNKEEFLISDQGHRIRLDRLVEINPS